MELIIAEDMFGRKWTFISDEIEHIGISNDVPDYIVYLKDGSYTFTPQTEEFTEFINRNKFDIKREE